MKILGWLMFGTMTVAFAVVFCKQQLEVQAEEQAALMSLPTPLWVQMTVFEENDKAYELATTQPSPPQAPLSPAAPTVAAGDFGDAIK